MPSGSINMTRHAGWRCRLQHGWSSFWLFSSSVHIDQSCHWLLFHAAEIPRGSHNNSIHPRRNSRHMKPADEAESDMDLQDYRASRWRWRVRPRGHVTPLLSQPPPQSAVLNDCSRCLRQSWSRLVERMPFGISFFLRMCVARISLKWGVLRLAHRHRNSKKSIASPIY